MATPSFAWRYDASLSPDWPSELVSLLRSRAESGVRAVYVLPVVALLSYSAKEGGIQQNVLTMIPSREPAAVVVNLMMYLSVLLSYPIYGPPVNEVLEAGSECEGER